MPTKFRDTSAKGEGMYCLQCQGVSNVLDSRPSTFRTIRSIRRRRVCLSCGHRWTTMEVDLSLVSFTDKVYSPMLNALNSISLLTTDALRSVTAAKQEAIDDDKHGEDQ
jgi:hypothetical protein